MPDLAAEVEALGQVRIRRPRGHRSLYLDAPRQLEGHADLARDGFGQEVPLLRQQRANAAQRGRPLGHRRARPAFEGQFRRVHRRAGFALAGQGNLGEWLFCEGVQKGQARTRRKISRRAIDIGVLIVMH